MVEQQRKIAELTADDPQFCRLYAAFLPFWPCSATIQPLLCRYSAASLPRARVLPRFRHVSAAFLPYFCHSSAFFCVVFASAHRRRRRAYSTTRAAAPLRVTDTMVRSGTSRRIGRSERMRGSIDEMQAVRWDTVGGGAATDSIAFTPKPIAAEASARIPLAIPLGSASHRIRYGAARRRGLCGCAAWRGRNPRGDTLAENVHAASSRAGRRLRSLVFSTVIGSATARCGWLNRCLRGAVLDR